MSAPPVTDAEREQIRVLHARGQTCGQIATALGRVKSTIAKQCKAMGLSFDRAATVEATAARAADNKERRAQAASDLLDDLQKLRGRAWSAYTVAMGTGEGLQTVELDLPPAQDVRAFYNAIGTCIDKQMAMERHDTGDEGADAARSLLSAVMESLVAKHGDGS